MTNYLAKFIPDYSETTAPLRELLRQDVDWCWLEHHTAAFIKLKELIAGPPVLRNFHVHQLVVLSANASQHELGAVCLQNGRPVAFASRALTETESRYAQIEKELLALVYACTKFHHYIYGWAVTVETDHQPLITILKKTLHTASARIQRMMRHLQRGAGSATSLMLSPVHICPPLTRLRKWRSTRSWWWTSCPHTGLRN